MAPGACGSDGCHHTGGSPAIDDDVGRDGLCANDDPLGNGGRATGRGAKGH